MSWTILNIDDDDAGRYAVSRLLSREGYRILESASGRDGYRLATSQPVDLVILDVNLPDINGIEICRMLKEHVDTATVPVLLMSASFVGAEDRVRGLELGADGYLTEPLEPEVLLAHVKALLRMRQAERNVERARSEAEAASRAKDHFLAVLSHELRTPLNPIIGAVELLSSMQLGREALAVVEIIQRNAELEARLIDDLLDITRIERGKLAMQFENVSLNRLIEDVVAIFRSDIEAKGIGLSVFLEATSATVRADAARLQQVIWNLVKNALKFTPKGESITIRTENHTSGRVVLTVADTGVGIEEHQLATIFNAFEQGTSSANEVSGGLGLGLAISRGIVDAHGGTLRASSSGRNRGAVFTLELDTVAERETTHPAATQPSRSARSLRILFVDDHVDTSATVKLLLERHGFNVVAAHDVASALRVAEEESFDLLVTDIGLPDGSGLELMEKIGTRQGIKGIAVSGYGMGTDVEASRRAGFHAHIIKPVHFEQLLRAIESAVAAPADAVDARLER